MSAGPGERDAAPGPGVRAGDAGGGGGGWEPGSAGAAEGEGVLEPPVTTPAPEGSPERPAPPPHRRWAGGSGPHGAPGAPGCRWAAAGTLRGEGAASVPARGCVCPRAHQPLWGSGAAVPACPRCVCARAPGALFV